MIITPTLEALFTEHTARGYVTRAEIEAALEGSVDDAGVRACRAALEARGVGYRDEALSARTRELLSTLTPTGVIREVWGRGELEREPEPEPAQDFEVSKERIKQIEAKALRKLRRPSSRARVQAFIFDDDDGAGE